MRRSVWSLTLIAALVALSGCDCGGETSEGGCDGGRCRDAGRVDGRVPDGATDGTVGGGDGGEGGTAVCVDLDRDGLGAGCAGGPDCDDTDINRGGPELCDTIDNDCDGMSDEGFLACRSQCVRECTIEAHPSGSGTWEPTAENSQGVIVDDTGWLTLGRSMNRAFSVWVANTNEGTVSKLDSRTNRETARYPSIGAMAPAGVDEPNVGCNACGSNALCRGNCPSRTAVDQNFDAYVGNRAFGRQGTVTKIASQESDCVDRNSNGTIDTSRDLNGDGIIQMDSSGEYVGVNDECILWTSAVGPAGDPAMGNAGLGGVPRALTVARAAPDQLVGNVWVGLYNPHEACQLNPQTGAVIGCVDITINPYGAATAADYGVWFTTTSGLGDRQILRRVDSTTLAVSSTSPIPDIVPGCPAAAGPHPGAYGLTLDGDGRVYLANFNCGNGGVLRYTPATDSWDYVDLGQSGTPRGVAADETSLWVALSNEQPNFQGPASGRVIQYQLSSFTRVGTWDLPTGTGLIGVGVDLDGAVWAISHNQSLAARLDPVTRTWTEHPVGLNPYTYSDFIGYGLNVFAEPRGNYRFTQEGCAGVNGTVTWTGATMQQEVPAMTVVEIYARTANTREGLGSATFIGPFTSPADFRSAPGPLPDGRFIEVDIRLRTSDRRFAPRVRSIDLGHVCTPIVG